MKSFVTAVAFIAAFIVGAFSYQAVVPNAKADSSSQRQWQYQCFAASGVAQVTERSNKMGQEGWELVTSAGSKKNTVWCFKRPAVKVVSP